MTLIFRPRFLRRFASSAASRNAKSPDISQHRSIDPQNQIRYCMERVREHDYEGYLASLFFPAHARPAQWALRALNLELSQVRDHVKQDLVGKMRFQWWRDAIQQTFQGAPPNHPILLALASQLDRNSRAGSSALSQTWFRKMISARESNLTTTQYATLSDLEQYCESTFSSLLYLQLESLGLRHVGLDHLASHLGKAMGLVAFVRAVPMQAMQGRFYLPVDVCANHQLSAEDAYRVVKGRLMQTIPSSKGKNSPASMATMTPEDLQRLQEASERLQDVVHKVGSLAHQHLSTARRHLSDHDLKPAVSPQELQRAWPVFLQSYPSILYLQRLEEAQFDVVHPKLFASGARSDWKMPLRLWYRSWKKIL